MKQIIYFFGKKCKRCNDIKEKTNELLEYAKSKDYRISLIDTDDSSNLDLASKYNVDSLPAIVIMKELKTVSGVTGKKITFDGDINFDHAKRYIDRRRLGLFDPENPMDEEKDDEIEEV